MGHPCALPPSYSLSIVSATMSAFNKTYLWFLSESCCTPVITAVQISRDWAIANDRYIDYEEQKPYAILYPQKV
jgi:hypothetical protein